MDKLTARVISFLEQHGGWGAALDYVEQLEIQSKRCMTLVGYITEESLNSIRRGGNESRGTVPIHKQRSHTAKYPLYRSVIS